MKKNFRFSLQPHNPPPDLLVHAWRLDSSSDVPQLTHLDLQPFSMDGTVVSKSQSSLSSPTLLNSHAMASQSQEDSSPSLPPSTARSAVNGHQTPTHNRLQPHHSLQKPSPNNLSAAHNSHFTSPASAASGSPAELKGSDGEASSPWCGAIGHATLGRSGRMIERLQADIDRLKRELNAEISRRQEIEKREDMNGRTILSLQAENNNLELSKDVDAGVIKRRDRKIDDLKAELEAERARRITLEAEKREAEKTRDEAVTKQWKEVSEAREVAKRASSHADVLELSHKQLSTEYRQRTEIFWRDLTRLTDDRDEERRKVKQLDVLVEQLQSEVQKMNRINKEMGDTFSTYHNDTEAKLRDMEEAASRHETEEMKLREETQRVVGEARWLINIGKNANKIGDYLPMEDHELSP